MQSGLLLWKLKRKVEGRQRQHAIRCLAVEKGQIKCMMKTAFKDGQNLKAFVQIS